MSAELDASKESNSEYNQFLKDKISNTIGRFSIVQKMLEDERIQMEQKHRALFIKCVNSQEAKQIELAITYAVECARIRTIAKKIFACQLALGKIFLNDDNVNDFIDTLPKVMPILQKVKINLAEVFPQASVELNHIEETLNHF